MDLTQGGLALVAKLGLSTVVDFERGRRQVSIDAILQIRTALESLGIEFVAENGSGEGVRLKKTRPSRRR